MIGHSSAIRRIGRLSIVVTMVTGSMPRRWYSVRFFFSSRRRHTRCLSDWSSDVCSSDLDRHPEHWETVQPVAHVLLPERWFAAGSLMKQRKGYHGSWRGGRRHIANTEHGLLRARREWPCCRCAAEQRYEFASFHHSITSSARARK